MPEKGIVKLRVTAMNSSFEHLTMKNIGYNSIARVLTFIFSALSSVVLGRCLLPSDYGIISFSFIFINFMGNFADVGIGSAIIQRKELDEPALHTAFTLQFFIGCAVIFATFILSTLAPLFFNNRDVVLIIRLLSLYFLLSNISFLPKSLLIKEMNFKKVAIAETSMSILNSVVAIVLALNGFGYWSIVIAYLSSNFVATALFIMFRPIDAKFQFDNKMAREFISFGGYLFLTGLLVFLIFNLDNFIIGTVKGAKDLGYYAIAFNWGCMICVLMYSVVLRVVFPVMAKLQDEEQKIRNAYLKTLEYSSYIVILANIILFIFSKEFLVYVLGHGSNKWLPALTSLRILCLYGIIRGLLEPIGQVITAMGKTRTLFIANLVASVIEVSAIYPALKLYGIEGVALTVTVAYLSQYFIFYRYLKSNLEISIVDLLRAVKPAFIAALVVIFLQQLFYGYHVDTVLLLLSKASIVAIVYFAILGVITNWEIFRTIKRLGLKAKIAG